MKRKWLGVTAVLTTAATVGMVQPVEAAGTPTNFAYSGTAFTSNARSATNPNIGSGRTVLAVLGCTVNVPEQDTNRALTTRQAGVPLTTSTAVNTSKSKQVRGGFATASRARIENATLGSPALGSLVVNGLDVIATAAFRNGEARPTTSVDVANATLTLAGQDPVEISIDQLRDGVDIPGVANIQLGTGRTTAGPNSATANAAGLRIDFANGARAAIAVANARIDRVVGRGPFSGGASVGRGTIGEDGSRIGPVIDRPMPCRGTGGRWLSEELARASLGEDVRTRDAQARVFTRTFGSGARVGKSEALVSRVVAVDDRLEIEGVVAKVSVLRRDDGSYQKSIEGTQVGSIRVDDELIEVPDPGDSVTIPGVARIRSTVEGSGRGSKSVVALRVELRDGSLTKLDVARARVKVG